MVKFFIHTLVADEVFTLQLLNYARSVNDASRSQLFFDVFVFGNLLSNDVV